MFFSKYDRELLHELDLRNSLVHSQTIHASKEINELRLQVDRLEAHIQYLLSKVILSSGKELPVAQETPAKAKRVYKKRAKEQSK